MRKIALTVVGLAAGLAVLAIPGTAFAHHVFLDFTANGAAVPNGDPNGTAAGSLDFDHDESDNICLDATTQNLATITKIAVVNRTDDTVLIDFGTTLDGCVVGTDEQMDALHDHADEYRILISTTDFPEGAVAGLFAERPPSTTTSTPASSSSSSSSSTSSSTTASTTPTAVNAVSVTPRFTG